MKFDPSVLNKLSSAAGSFLVKTGERLKEADMGTALTKAHDVVDKLALNEKKKQLEDLLDSPKMENVKSAARTAGDFLGYIPYYAQSIPSMIKGALGKGDFKSGKNHKEDE